MIGIINLGNSNITSLTNSFIHLGLEYEIVDKSGELHCMDKIVLPGVGTFGNGIRKMQELNLIDELREEVLVNKKPILGICLGMQLFFESSEESPDVIGLALLEGKVVKLPSSNKYEVPRIGWAESLIEFDFLSLSKGQLIDFYYIHSFYVQPKHSEIISISTDNVIGAIADKNIFGCQFHPEKSHLKGLNILKSFAEIKL